jgi:hypothetical protein
MYINIKLNQDLNDCSKKLNVKTDELTDLNDKYNACLNIKFADENIFSYIKCINVPRKKVCKNIGQGGETCQTRLTDCTKFRDIIMNDPVALNRIKLLNDQTYDASKNFSTQG